MPNDLVLVYYLLVPCMSQYFRLSCIFLLWVDYISPHHFVTLSNFYATFHFVNKVPQLSVLWFAFLSSLSSFFHFLGRQTPPPPPPPPPPLEDDNSRDAWLSLIALKRKWLAWFWGSCRWSSSFKCYRYCIYGSQLFKLGLNII